jgi:16S rRNA (guanine527-N7)-methyltransferase
VTQPRSPHRAALEALRSGGTPPAATALDRLALYLDVVAEWSPRVNLTGARTPEERVSRLVAAVWPLVDLVPGGRLIDIGSGNGSPGLVLALARDDLAVTLLEPRARRWAFLREVARRASRPVDVVRARHDTYTGAPADTVTVRALVLPLAQVAPLVRPGGRLIVVGTRRHPQEPFAEASGESRPGAGVWVYRRA